MLILLLAFCIGIVAGLRTLTAPAAVSWAARMGLFSLNNTWLAFLGYRWTPWILSLLAIGELINDKLPNTPSRKVPPQFAARILSGALAGAAVSTPHGSPLEGGILGIAGAVAGTLGGAYLRGRLARALGKDIPAALLEDAAAIVLGISIMSQLS
jgi:uncharacterized membrane protein